ncbi:hypothetical protein EYF80_048464 [Liparis tanakae]|uniref:Uncharacterized protein n=1 Tax=Liparis tanakae TaxID=230148 RepID=A0A4Z2FK90_9TELE|nr:hypothetical protein EYF80_048464 [Liparis tanakae]
MSANTVALRRLRGCLAATQQQGYLLMLNYPASPGGSGKVNTHQLALIYFTVPQQPGIEACTLSLSRA